MAWKYKVCTADTIVCNDHCIIKKIALEEAVAGTTATVYDEVDGGHASAIWVLRTVTDYRLTNERDFGDEGVLFNVGCCIEFTPTNEAGTVLVVYKP